MFLLVKKCLWLWWVESNGAARAADCVWFRPCIFCNSSIVFNHFFSINCCWFQSLAPCKRCISQKVLNLHPMNRNFPHLLQRWIICDRHTCCSVPCKQPNPWTFYTTFIKKPWRAWFSGCQHGTYLWCISLLLIPSCQTVCFCQRRDSLLQPLGSRSSSHSGGISRQLLDGGHWWDHGKWKRNWGIHKFTWGEIPFHVAQVLRTSEYERKWEPAIPRGKLLCFQRNPGRLLVFPLHLLPEDCFALQRTSKVLTVWAEVPICRFASVMEVERNLTFNTNWHSVSMGKNTVCLS